MADKVLSSFDKMLLKLKDNKISDEDVAVFIKDVEESPSIYAYVIGFQSERKKSYKFNDSIDFLNNIKKLFQILKVKGVVLYLFKHEPLHFDNNMVFLQAVKDELDSLKLNYYFITDFNFAISVALKAANFQLMNNETLLYVWVDDECIDIIGLQFSENGYKIIRYQEIKSLNAESIEETMKILQKDERKSIILIAKIENSIADIIKYESEKIKIFKLPFSFSIINKGVIEISKYAYDRSYTVFHITPWLYYDLTIGCVYNNLFYPKFKLHAGPTELPIKTVIFGKKANDNYKIKFSNSAFTLWQKLNMAFTNYQINLSIDMNNFVEVNVQKNSNENDCIPDELELLPMICEVEVPTQIPVIALWNNFSYVLQCDKNDNNGGGRNKRYSFMERWNGMYGKSVAMSFVEKKTKIGQEAFADYETHPSFVVYDLLSILSKENAEDVTINPKWGFEIAKLEGHSLLIKHDSCTVGLHYGPPSFMMAIYIQQITKMIKEENGGESVKKVAFHLIEMDNEKLVKKRIKDACKYLKKRCIFI